MAARTRVYVDMVGDLFHAGHVALLRAARALGDELVVGVLSDADAAAYKRTPVMTLEERLAEAVLGQRLVVLAGRRGLFGVVDAGVAAVGVVGTGVNAVAAVGVVGLGACPGVAGG